MARAPTQLKPFISAATTLRQAAECTHARLPGLMRRYCLLPAATYRSHLGAPEADRLLHRQPNAL